MSFFVRYPVGRVVKATLKGLHGILTNILKMMSALLQTPANVRLLRVPPFLSEPPKVAASRSIICKLQTFMGESRYP